MLHISRCTQKKILYVFAEVNKHFSEDSAKKLGITCNITVAIRVSCRYFDKWIWKDKLLVLDVQPYQKRKEWPYMRIYRPQKGNNSFKEVSCDTDT